MDIPEDVLDQIADKILEKMGNRLPAASSATRGDSPIIIPGRDSEPRASQAELFRSPFGPLWAAGVRWVRVEPMDDRFEGVVVRITATGTDGRQAFHDALTSDTIEENIDRVKDKFLSLPANGVAWDPNDPNTQEQSQRDKDLVRKRYMDKMAAKGMRYE